MKQAAKEAFENKMHQVARAYLSNQEYLVQQEVYNILPKLNLGRIFLAVYFVNENLLEERAWIYSLKKNWASYLIRAYIFSRNQMLIVYGKTVF